MEPIQFSAEEMYPAFGLSGVASIHQSATLPHPDEVDPTDGIRNIQCGQDWWVRVQWTQNGSLIYGLSGTWKLQVFFEKMGPEEFNLMSTPIDVNFSNENPRTYTRLIPFVSTSVNVPPGLYKVAVSLTLVGPTGIPLPVAAIAEGPVLQFYEVGP